jgi:hypothetical protein
MPNSLVDRISEKAEPLVGYGRRKFGLAIPQDQRSRVARSIFGE